MNKSIPRNMTSTQIQGMRAQLKADLLHEFEDRLWREALYQSARHLQRLRAIEASRNLLCAADWVGPSVAQIVIDLALKAGVTTLREVASFAASATAELDVARQILGFPRMQSTTY